jgi:hypothetical protein
MHMTKETVGKLSTELLPKKVDDTHCAEEQMREQLTDYDRNIYEAIERGKKEFTGDFYVVVISKRERLLSNIYRLYYLTRASCPTPDHDQTVYKYHRKSEHIEFIWVIPDQQACQYLTLNALTLHKEEKVLLNFVLLFADGTLFQRAQQLNGELN